MNVLEKRCTKTLAGNGNYAFDAEMKLEEENGNIIFVHVNYFDIDNLTVADGSIFDFVTQGSEEEPNVKYLEQYDSLRSAKKSRFFDCFCQLDQMVDEIS